MVAEHPPRVLQPTQRPIYDIWVHICKHADVDTLKNIACVSKEDAETCLPLLWVTVEIEGFRPGDEAFRDSDSTLDILDPIIHPDVQEDLKSAQEFTARLTVMAEHIEALSQEGRPEAVRTLSIWLPSPVYLGYFDWEVDAHLVAQWTDVLQYLAAVISQMVNLEEFTFRDGAVVEGGFAAAMTQFLFPALRYHARKLKSVTLDMDLEHLPHGFLPYFPNLDQCFIVGESMFFGEEEELLAVEKQHGITSVKTFHARSVVDLGLVQGCQLHGLDIHAELPGAEDEFFTQFQSSLANSRNSLKELRVALPEDADWSYFLRKVISKFKNLTRLYLVGPHPGLTLDLDEDDEEMMELDQSTSASLTDSEAIWEEAAPYLTTIKELYFRCEIGEFHDDLDPHCGVGLTLPRVLAAAPALERFVFHGCDDCGITEEYSRVALDGPLAIEKTPRSRPFYYGRLF